MEVIVLIILSFRKPQDLRIWNYDPKGCFTIRSAFGVAHDWFQGENDALSHFPVDVVIDKKLLSVI